MNQIAIDYSLATVPVNFFDAGNTRYKINLIYKIKQVVLVEVFTSNVYKYFAVNYLTKEKKYLFFTKKPIPKSRHKDVSEKIMEFAVLFEVKAEETKPDNKVINSNRNAKNEYMRKANYKVDADQAEKSHEIYIHGLIERYIFPGYGSTIKVSNILGSCIVLQKGFPRECRAG